MQATKLVSISAGSDYIQEIGIHYVDIIVFWFNFVNHTDALPDNLFT